MIAWYFVWAELLMWTFSISFLILPVPLTMKYFLVKTYNMLWKSFYCRAFMIANLCIIVFQFGDSYNQMLKYQANKDALGAGMTTGAGSLGEKIDVNMKLFRAQRNVYLSFFCLFEIFIFYGFSKLVTDLQKERTPTRASDKVDEKMDKLQNKIEKKNDEIRQHEHKAVEKKEELKSEVKKEIKEIKKETQKTLSKAVTPTSNTKVATPVVIPQAVTPIASPINKTEVKATPTKKAIDETAIYPAAEMVRSR